MTVGRSGNAGVGVGERDDVPRVPSQALSADGRWLPSELATLRALHPTVDEQRCRQRRVAVELQRLHEGIRELEEVAGLPEVANAIPGWCDLTHTAAHALGDPTSLSGTMSPLRLQVAFVGRTEAGKSTLINGLLRRSVAEIGNGHQRTTRVPHLYRYTHGIDIIDTPGVAAAGGEDDEVLAQAVAKRADFLLYVLNDDQLGGREAEVLSRLDDVSAPCMLILNVKRDIDGSRRGKDERIKRRRFLESPEWLFDPVKLDEHAARVAEAAPMLWKRAGERLYPVHALAAVMATDPRFAADAERLEASSRVSHIGDELEAAARRWVPSLRVIEVSRPFVVGADRAQAGLQDLGESLRSSEQRLREVARSTGERVNAIVQSHQDSFRSRIALALEPVRADLPAVVGSSGGQEFADRWRSSFEETQLGERFRLALEELANEIGEVLTSPVVVDEGISWEPPSIEFELDIDMGQIIADALLDEVRGRGLQAIVRALLKQLAKRGAQGGAGGPAGFVAAAFFTVLSMASKVHVGRKDAARRRQLRATSYLRDILDGLDETLPLRFGEHVQRGNLGAAITDHRRSLLRAAEALADLIGCLDSSRAQVAEFGVTWTSVQVENLQRIWGGHEGGWSVERGPRGGAVTVTGDPHVPWAAICALEQLTGVSINVQTPPMTGLLGTSYRPPVGNP